MKEISSKLDNFMHEITDCDMGNDPTQTKELLDTQENRSVQLYLLISASNKSIKLTVLQSGLLRPPWWWSMAETNLLGGTHALKK